RFADRFEPVQLLLPYEEGGKLAELYALGAPIEAREDHEAGVLVRARLPQREVRRFARYLVAEARSERATRAACASWQSGVFGRTRPSPSARTRGMQVSTSPHASASNLPRARVRLWERVSRSRSRRATPVSSSRDPDWPRDTASRS